MASIQTTATTAARLRTRRPIRAVSTIAAFVPRGAKLADEGENGCRRRTDNGQVQKLSELRHGHVTLDATELGVVEI